MKYTNIKIFKEYSNILLSPTKYEGEHYGLVEGEVGLMLYNAYFYKLFNDEQYYVRCSDLLQQLLNKHTNNYTLGYGLAGIAWGINELKNNEILADDCNIWLENTNYLLKEHYFRMIESSNFDYFSGATGILNYFLLQKKIDSPMIDIFLEKIQNLSVEYFFLPKKEINPKGEIYNIINLGVPHGATGIILLLLKLELKMNLGLESLIHTFIDKLWEFRNPVTQNFMFHSLLGDIKRESTLAWCYGDLPILYLLNQIVKMKNGTKYQEHLYLLNNKTLHRKDYFVNNFTLCHGLPVIMYFYYKLWKITSDNLYHSEYQKWKSILEDEWEKNISLNNTPTNPSLHDTSLFNGLPGYIIVLLTIHENIPDTWDGILLI